MHTEEIKKRTEDFEETSSMSSGCFTHVKVTPCVHWAVFTKNNVK